MYFFTQNWTTMWSKTSVQVEIFTLIYRLIYLFYINRRRVDFATDKIQRDWSLARRWNVLCPGVEGGEAAIRIPRGSKAAPCMLLTSPRLALNNYRAILFILMPRIARAFRHSVFSINVMSRLYGRPLSRRPTRCDSTRSGLDPVLLLRVLPAKPGEHSFAEEAKVANYRVAIREGGLMRSPMTGHIRPSFCSCRWTMPGDDSTLASKSTDRCVNPTTDAFVSVSHLFVFHPGSPSWIYLSLFSSLFLSDPPRLLSSSHRNIIVLLSRFVQYRTSWDPKRDRIQVTSAS